MTKANQTIENVGGVPKLASDALARALTMLFIERAKAMKDVWQKMTEAQQREWVESTAHGCKVHSIAAVNTILSTERTAVAASIKKTTNAKDMQAVLVIDPENSEEALIKLLLAKEGARCMVVFSDTSHYWEGMDSIPLDPDQYSIIDEIEKMTPDNALNWAINIPIMIGETLVAAPSQHDADLYARSIRAHLLASDDEKIREYAKVVYAMPYQHNNTSHQRAMRKGDWEALVNWFAKLKSGDVEVKPFALIEYRPENQHDNVEFDAGKAFQVGNIDLSQHDHRIEFKIRTIAENGEYLSSVDGSTAEGQSDSDHISAAYELISSLCVDGLWTVDSITTTDTECLFDAKLYFREDQYSSAEGQELAQSLCGVWAINEKPDTTQEDQPEPVAEAAEPNQDTQDDADGVNLHWVECSQLQGAILVSVVSKDGKYEAQALGHRVKGSSDLITTINGLMRLSAIDKDPQDLVYHQLPPTYDGDTKALTEMFWVYPLSSVALTQGDSMQVNIRIKENGVSGSYQQYRTHKDSIDEAIADLVKKSGNERFSTGVEVTNYNDRAKQVKKFVIW